MGNRNLILILLISISVLALNFQCAKEAVTRSLDQTFNVSVNIYPLKKIYSVTDTIWLETDLPNKFSYDTKSNSNIFIDSGNITFSGNYNEFGTTIQNPANGFCDVITSLGYNTNRMMYDWGAAGAVEDYGCGQSNYTSKIGFKPNYKGIYSLDLFTEQVLLGSCPNKSIPYYSSIEFFYKNVDLNLDIFNSLSKNDQGGNEGISFYTNKINKRKTFVFKVE